MWRRGATIVAIVAVLFLAGCGGSAGQSFKNQAPPPSSSNPTPTITTISPNSTTAGDPAFTLTVDGTAFVAASTVSFGGMAAITTFVSATQLTAAIPAGDIATAGSAAVTVTNPTPGGGTSNAVNFTITSGTNPGSAVRILPASSVAVVPDPTGKFGKFAYVTNPNSNNVSMYTIGATTGALTLIGTVPAGASPTSVAIDPFGKFAYAANDGGFVPGAASVSMYTIDGTTGTLTSIGATGEHCPAELCTAFSVGVHPSGKFAYVANGYPEDDVSMFAIDPTTGALTFIGAVGTASPGASNTTEIAIDPSGKFAYVVGDGCALDTFDGDISMYTIDTTTGALSFTGSVPAGSCPISVTVDPSGRFTYVTDNQDDNVAMYSINGTTGALTFIGNADAGTGPSTVAVDPTGKFAYVTNPNSNNVSMYTVNSTTGVLTSIGTVAAGSLPTSIAIDPSGKFAYVANSGSNDVSMYTINGVTGALTLIGTIGT